jgi:mannosyltransferase
VTFRGCSTGFYGFAFISPLRDRRRTLGAPARRPVAIAPEFPGVITQTLLPLAAILLCRVFLRFFHISYLSLWNDEAFSRFYYQTGLPFMWTEGLRSESSPPLYYMAVGAWVRLFGGDETALRALSAVSSSVAILLVYALGRELLGRRAALVAAALFALSPTQIYYAQEARPYAFLLIPVALTLLACARYLGRPGRLALIGYVLAATIAVYTHATMTFFVAACGTAMLWALWRAGDKWSGGPAVWHWLAANLVVAVFALPAMIGMTQHVETGTLSWIAPVSWRDLGAVLSNTVVGTLVPARFPGGELAVLLTGAVALGLWRRRLPDRVVTIVLVPAGLFTGFVILASLTMQPILLSRIFRWVGIPVCLVLAQVLAVAGWRRLVCAAAIGGVIGVGLFYQLGVNPYAKEPWRAMVSSLEPGLAKADLVVLGPNTDPAALMYYAPELPHVVMWADRPTQPSALGIMPGLFGIKGVTLDDIADRIARGGSVIVLTDAVDQALLLTLLESVGPPERRDERRCLGGDEKPTTYPCGVAALAWRPVWGPTPN